MRTGLTSEGQTAGPQMVVLELQLPSIHAARVPLFPAGLSHAITGAVHSNMRSVDNFHYPSEAWTRRVADVPATEPMAAAPKHAQLCAKDLIAELQIINGQVRRMMSQVERAVANLALTG